ncbi:hypothetical protein ACER0C_002500 [Sarotherodon galilaeus]
MSAVTASLCSTLMFVLFVSADQKNITAESGQDVTLTCRAPNYNIIVVKWSRADLRDEYVLLYRDGHFVTDDQHPSFKNRVDLQDRQMKDGDVSLILKNLTVNDTGTYECRVVQRVRGPVTLINIIHLHVDPPGQTEGQEKDEDKKDGGKEDKEKEDGSVGLIVGLSVPAVLVVVFFFFFFFFFRLCHQHSDHIYVLVVVAVVGFLIYRRCKLNPADPHVAEHLQPECEPKILPAESGQDVTLTCRTPNSESENMSQQLHQTDY